MSKQRWRLIRVGIGAAFLVPTLALEYAPVPSWCVWVELGLALVGFLIVGYDVLWKTLKRIAHFQLMDESFLMTIACAGAFVIGEYPEALAVMLFSQLGEYMEKRAVDSSRRSVKALLSINPDKAHVDGIEEEVLCDDIAIGTLLVVKVGERIPIDGIVERGDSDLDLSSLNGESMPRHVEEGDSVPSSAINLSGVLYVRTTTTHGESTASRMIRLVEEARTNKAPGERFITKFAKVFTPIVVVAAILVGTIAPLCIDPTSWAVWATWLKKAMVFLVVSCPCALVISVPLSYFGAIGMAGRLGIFVKGGHVFAKLCKVNIFCLDKTGTLTKGKFEVVEVNAANPDEVLYLCACCEQYSNHPLAKSVLDAYHNRYSRELPVCTDVREYRGKGVAVRLEDHEIAVGNAVLMQELGATIENPFGAGTVLYVAKDCVCLGNVILADAPKDDSKSAVSALRQIGKVVMLSGDNERVVADMADQMEVDAYQYGLMPQDKVDYVVQHKGCAFVGDGINDAPVLVASEVGFAMGGLGQDAAIESSDVVLVNDSLQGVVKTYRIARKTQRIVYENIIFALGVKLGVMAASLTSFGSHPAMMWLAVVADVGVAALAILNALRTTRFKGKYSSNGK